VTISRSQPKKTEKNKPQKDAKYKGKDKGKKPEKEKEKKNISENVVQSSNVIVQGNPSFYFDPPVSLFPFLYIL
jgi:hypothetical protein